MLRFEIIIQPNKDLFLAIKDVSYKEQAKKPKVKFVNQLNISV
jgi:hypothetical protein